MIVAWLKDQGVGGKAVGNGSSQKRDEGHGIEALYSAANFTPVVVRVYLTTLGSVLVRLGVSPPAVILFVHHGQRASSKERNERLV